MCIVCFGVDVDVDDDMSLHHSAGAAHARRHEVSGGLPGQEIVRPRRVVLEHTPVVTP
jgi:hypothetical protein